MAEIVLTAIAWAILLGILLFFYLFMAELIYECIIEPFQFWRKDKARAKRIAKELDAAEWDDFYTDRDFCTWSYHSDDYSPRCGGPKCCHCDEHYYCDCDEDYCCHCGQDKYRCICAEYCDHCGRRKYRCPCGEYYDH